MRTTDFILTHASDNIKSEVNWTEKVRTDNINWSHQN